MKQSELRQIIKEEISKILNENEIKPGDSFKNYKGSIHTVVSVSPNGNQIKAKDEKGNVLTFRW